MELVKQLRELLVKANVCMKADWEQAVKIAFESIYKMQNMKIIEGTLTEKGEVDPCTLLTHSEVAWDSFNLMTKYCGSVKLKNNVLVHDGIHPVDAVHVALAKKLGCSMIATLDRDFKETDSEVKSLILLDDPF
jgi:predicted nucleic acid-binding protein